MQWTFTLDEIENFAREFWNRFSDKKVFAFTGEMGAGKTTFIQAVCRAMGVRTVMSSPTFSIINEYEYSCEGTPKAVFHIDLYRIKDEEEAISAGVEDVLLSGHICFVEWPEKAMGLFPEDTVRLQIKLMNAQSRQLVLI